MPSTQEQLANALAARLTDLARGAATTPVELPPDQQQDPLAALARAFNAFLADYQTYSVLLQALSRGDLDQRGPRSGLAIASSYKALQAHLRHLTWTARQIAAGDFSQRVDFMGEFSEAFNKMADDLDASFTRIAEQNASLLDLNARLNENLDALTRTKRELSESEAKLAHIVADAHEAIVLVDIVGRVVHWNPAAERLFGYHFTEIIGQPIQDHIAPPTERQLFLEHFPAFLRGADSLFGQRMEMSAMRRDKSIFPVEVSYSRTSLQGHPHGLISFRDITERWKLDALKRDVDRMTHHDLKSPLNAIIGLPQLIAEYDVPEEVHELLDMITTSGYDMLNMLNLSLGLYKMETGSYQLEPEPVDLAALVARVAAEQVPLAEDDGKSFELLLDGKPLTPAASLLAMGERLLCYSMLSNLSKNAVEASPQGGRIRISLASGPKTVRLDIHNQGAVPQAVRGKLFEKYATWGKPAGTGLGCYSAKLMARVQHGDIGFETDEATGTTISVTLPAC